MFIICDVIVDYMIYLFILFGLNQEVSKFVNQCNEIKVATIVYSKEGRSPIKHR